MSRKVHIVRLENEVDEQGIQIRSDNPAPLEDRIHVNRVTSDMYSHFKGKTHKMNIGVYPTDPLNSYDEVWVNDSEGKLKWKKESTVYEMNLPDSDQLVKISSTQDFYKFLVGLEDRQVKDEALVAPNSLYDSFKARKKGASYNKLNPIDGRLRNEEGDVVGVYELEERQTQPANRVEGAATLESQGFRPESMTDNLDGTHSVIFNGDITGFLSVGKKFAIYEREKEIVNPYGGNQVGRNGGIRYNVKSENIYPALDINGKPELIDVSSYSYNINTNKTTVVFNDKDLDLTLGFAASELNSKVSFVGMIVDSVVGGNKLSGVLDPLQIQEMNAVKSSPVRTSKGVITHDILNVLRTDYRYEKVNFIWWNCSPDKNNWLILARFGQLSDTDHWRIWYSKDSLASLQYVEDFYIPADYGGGAGRNVDLHSQEFMANMWDAMIWEEAIEVKNDGRFVFSLAQHDNPYSRWNKSIWFGNLSSEDFIIKSPKSSFGGWAGTIAFENSTAHSYYSAGQAMDWESGLFAISVSRGNEDAWIQFWYLDFDQYLAENSGAIQYYYMGLDYRQHHYPSVTFWKHFEGQKMLFNTQRHSNQHFYAFKVRRSRILEIFRDSQNHNVAGPGGSGVVNNSGDTLYSAFCGTGDYEGGSRSQHSSYMHEIAAGANIDHWKFSDSNVLMMFGGDNTNAFMFATYTDFGRTNYGLESKNKIDFDIAPDTLGSHAIVKLSYDIEPVVGSLSVDFTGDVNSHLNKAMPSAIVNYGDNPLASDSYYLSNDFESIPWIGEDEIHVTGGYSQLYHQYEFKHRPEAVSVSVNASDLKGKSTTVLINDDFTNIEPPVAGPEQLVNSTFDTSINSWSDESKGAGNIAHSTSYGGSLKLNHGGDYTNNRADALSEVVTLSAGVQYTFFIDLEENNTTGSIGGYIQNASTKETLSQVAMYSAGRYFVNYKPDVSTDVQVRIGTDSHGGGAASAIVSNASLTPTTKELNGWNETGAVTAPDTFVRLENINGNGALRIKDGTTTGYVSAHKDVTIESGVQYLIEFDIRKFVVENADSTDVLLRWGYQSSGLNTNGHINTSALAPNVAWESGRTYRFITPVTTATDGRLQLSAPNGGVAYMSDVIIDNVKLTKLQDVVVTPSVVQAGQSPSGGDIELAVEHWRKNTSNVKALVSSGLTGLIPAGSTTIAIRNKINALAQVAPSPINNERLEHSYSKYFSKCTDRLIFEQYENRNWNENQRGLGANDKALTNEYFNIELSVAKDINYNLTLEIFDPNTETVVWSYTNIFNSGKFTIPVDYTKLKRSHILRANSFTERESDYKHAKFRYDYAFNNFGTNGVKVDGNWTFGFTVDTLCVRDIRISTSQNNLVNGIQPVVVTHTNLVQGSEPTFLKHDNDPLANNTTNNTLFWNNRNDDGQSYYLRPTWRAGFYKGGYAVSTFNQHHREHSAQVDGYGLLLAVDGISTEYAFDKQVAEIIKIPDYREMHGVQVAFAPGTLGNIHIQGQATPRAGSGAKLAQKFVVPDLQYSNLKFPVRTLELELRRTWGTEPKGFGFKDVYVRCRIVGDAAGFPDETNVLAQSLTKIPLNQVPVHDDRASISNDARKRLPFIFDNLQLTPAQTVYILVELEGLDIEAYNDDGLLIAFSARPNVSGGAYANINNVWNSTDFDIWYWFYDYYRIWPWLNHESGPNPHTSWHGRANYGELTHSVSNSTLGRIGTGNSNKFIGTYQVWGHNANNDSVNASVFKGGTRTWGFVIDNENIASPDHPPIIKDPEILGVEDQSKVDKDLVLAHAIGYTPDGYSGLELYDTGVPAFMSNTSGLASDPEKDDDFSYGRNVHYGGFQLSYGNNAVRQFTKYSGLTAGIIEDDEFFYGRACRMGGYRKYISHYSNHDMTPYCDDFAWEMEINPELIDIDAGAERNPMLWGSSNLYYISIRNGVDTNNEARYHFYSSSPWVNKNWISLEKVPAQYHRFRVTRNQYTGIKFWRNFTKDDETAWQEMSMDTTVASASIDAANGYQIGRYDNVYNYFTIGGWTNNANHDWYGKLGYFKLAIGSDSFAYPALEGVFNGTQPEIGYVRNKGEHILGYSSINSGMRTVRFKTKAETVIVRHSSLAPSQINTPEIILGYSQILTDAGTHKAVRHTLRREDIDDPAKLNGYILNFYKE